MVRYNLEIARPENHLVRVEIEAGDLSGGSADFVFPCWSPGSYAIRDYAKNVVRAEALDSSGKPLPCRKINKDTWRVEVTGGCRFVYDVYCHEHGVQSSFVDDSHASLHGPALFASVSGKEKEPCRLTVNFPDAWRRISTGLRRAGDSPHAFEAADYDTLLDSPLEIGNHRVFTFYVRERPHHVAIYGDGNLDPEKLVEDTKKIVETTIPIFGDVPYEDYTFILQLLSAEGGGGLEHSNSALMQVNRWKFKPEEEYRKKLALIAHEFFHLWNVKRLTPRPLVSFDYTREIYTDMLWVAEGITSYYEDLILLRAGLYNTEQYFEALMNDYKIYRETPGRAVQSVCESSFDTWIKFYRLTEGARNLTISYYRKGALIGLALDLLIRQATRGRANLDHVMRLLYEETFLKSRIGYTLEDFRGACERIAGRSLGDFFAKHVEGRDAFDPAEFLQVAGLRLAEKNDRKEKSAESSARGYLGVEWRRIENRIFISSISWDTPAAGAGLCPGDELIGWDGFRVLPETFSQRVAECKPGTRHRIQFFRQDILKELEVNVGEKPKEWKVEQVENPDGESREILKGWIGTDNLKRETESDSVQSVSG